MMDVVLALHRAKQERLELERQEHRVWQKHCRELVHDVYRFGRHEDKLHWRPEGCGLCRKYVECLCTPEKVADSEAEDSAILSDWDEEEEP